ncbi:IS200/IS605 family transposase ISCsa5 [Thermus phage YS40_Isch]|nr:IS200/IS605 family transposase ISCsa5 [Thermus phage YS40_Isch]
MLKAYKYRIYPNKKQQELFEKTFGSCRFVWNKMLEEKLKAFQETKKVPRITPAKYKEEYPFLKEVDSLALANVQLQQEKAFKNYFKNKKHFKIPNFKKKKKYKQSYTTNNIKVDFEGGYLYLPKVKGGIKAIFHRQFEGKIKSATIVKTTTGKYYVSILVDIQNPKNKSKEPTNFVAGIDLGLKNFAVITNDTEIKKVEHPKYLSKALKKIKRFQRKLSRQKIGSKNREKTRKRLAREYEYVNNARNDFLHKLSKTIIDENQVVVVEDLNVKSLSQTHLAKHVLDSAWSRFVQYLTYKAEWYDRKLLVADRFFPSSKTCSSCGYIHKDLQLKDRSWVCPSCGTTHDRDENAAKNLRNYGIKYLVGLERPEFTPVEIASKRSMKQEATTSISE